MLRHYCKYYCTVLLVPKQNRTPPHTITRFHPRSTQKSFSHALFRRESSNKIPWSTSCSGGGCYFHPAAHKTTMHSVDANCEVGAPLVWPNNLSAQEILWKRVTPEWFPSFWLATSHSPCALSAPWFVQWNSRSNFGWSFWCVRCLLFAGFRWDTGGEICRSLGNS